MSEPVVLQQELLELSFRFIQQAREIVEERLQVQD